MPDLIAIIGRFSIRTKLTILLLIATNLSIIILSVAIYKIGISTLDKQIRNEVKLNAEQILNSINELIYNRYNDMQMLISDSTLNSDEASLVEKHDVLINQSSNLGWFYNGMHITDNDGIVIVSTNRKDLNKSVSDFQWYKDSLEVKPNVTDVINSPFNDKKELIYTNLLQDKENNVLGTIFAEFDINIIKDKLKDVSENIQVYLINKNKRIITSKESIENVYTLDDLKKYQDQYIFTEIESEGLQTFWGNDWRIIVQIHKDIAYAPIKNFTRWIWIIAIMISITIFIIGNQTSKIITVPIRSLIKGVSKIERGILNQKIPVNSKDEFGFLANTFNKMTSSLLEKTNNILAEKGKYKAILESTDVGIILFDIDNKTTACNSTFKKIFNILYQLKNQNSQFVFKKLFDSKTVKGKNLKKLQAIILTNNLKNKFSTELTFNDKNYKIFTVFSQPVSSENEKLLGRIWVFNDVTEEREAQKTKNDFISVASHKLRTPLSAINWTIQLFKSNRVGKLSKEQMSLIQQLDIQSNRLKSLVKILMNSAEIHNNKIELTSKIFNIGELLENVSLNTVKKNYPDKKLVFNPPLRNLKKITVFADEGKIKQVLEILVENACIYSKEDEKIIQISINLNIKKKIIEINISDKGIGISNKEQRQVFSKFFRAEKAITQYTEGTGLSLYLAKIIMDSHNQKIGFWSKLNKGSTFFITLKC